MAPARDPPARETGAGGSMDHPGDPGGIDPLAQREPDCISGERIAWWHLELRR